MSMLGKKVRPFDADAYCNGEFVNVSSESIMGKWSVFCFYPADFTFVCPTELEDLQAVYESDLKALGVDVYSVSTDTHFVHKAWHDHSDAIGKVMYTMIGDPSHTITHGFDVMNYDEDGFPVGLAQRATFIVDPDGIIQSVEITSGGMGRDASQIVAKVKAAQYMRDNPGEVCPAKWAQTGETLTPSLDLVGKI